MKQGKMIVVDAPDGAGKTTMVQYLYEVLMGMGYDVVKTREPGGSELGEKLRKLVLENSVDPMTELLIMAAARSDHIDKLIKPALAAGKIVLCDRFVDSSIAYQGMGRGLLPEVLMVHHQLIKNFTPDYTLFLSVDPEVAERRLIARGVDINRFDQETTRFKERCQEGYKIARWMFNRKIIQIDANGSMEEVQEQIRQWAENDFVLDE